MRRGRARFQLEAVARQRSRDERREALRQEIAAELQKFVGRRQNGDLRLEVVGAAMQQMLLRILPKHDVRVRRLVPHPQDPTRFELEFLD